MISNVRPPASKLASQTDEDRRKFIATCGKFVVVTPPALTVLLSTSLTSSAIANSSGHKASDGNDRRDWWDWDWLNWWDKAPKKGPGHWW